jgi:DNA-binding transcriptional regulator YhcF (GntR family)
MNIEVDTASPVPPYEQIRAQIADLAAAMALPTGTKLPTIRQLAVDLGLAPGTVARAYRELEAAGVVISRVRHGTTIAPVQARPPAEVQTRAAEAARAYALAVRSLGLSRDEAIAAFDQHSTDLPGQPAPAPAPAPA